ncbi:hypothetical protein CYMTET_54448 [Cymbomonas tetramitiformis]|uniref:Alpha/beta hydrolase fold-3 domain-containing protein n=1 Tax=Cymbomonas tetramitiformis TaxID=36881 RepID=A0AAE0ENQ0_9CHLO|nr:hypothetical protein CYMTET_54448 [Cymbomonas tetramitiformis]
MPHSIVVTAGFDVLRDQGVAYANKLKAAGVDVIHRHYDSFVHGFANIGIIKEVQAAMLEICADLQHALSITADDPVAN